MDSPFEGVRGKSFPPRKEKKRKEKKRIINNK